MRRILYLVITTVIMLVVSRFIIRIVDATVQIDHDIWILVLLLIMINVVIVIISYQLYQRTKRFTGGKI